AFVISDRADASIKIESLPQSDIQRAHAAADGGGQRAFDSDAEIANCIDGVIREPIVELGLSSFAREHFVPDHTALARVSFLHRGVENAHGGFPDIPAGAVAFNEWNDRIVRHLVASVAVSDPRATCGHRKAVV